MKDLTVGQKELCILIKGALKETRIGCDYKEAHLPKGWAEVKIEDFPTQLTKKICGKFSCIKK